MMIVSKFDIGDTVQVGPHVDAKIVRISIGSAVTYVVSYWVDGHPSEYVAYDWEIKLLESVNK